MILFFYQKHYKENFAQFKICLPTMGALGAKIKWEDFAQFKICPPTMGGIRGKIKPEQIFPSIHSNVDL